MFRRITDMINYSIKQAATFEEEVSKIKTFSKKIKDNDIKKIISFVQKKYSETVFECPGVFVILQHLYMRLSEGFDINDSVLLIKAEIIKDIHKKQILYVRDELFRSTYRS